MNSVLNPEAPEFHPLLNNAVQDGYVRVNKTIKTSNCFPAGPSYEIYKTYTDFNFITCKISENVVSQSNQIVVTELPDGKLIRRIDDSTSDTIADVSDSLLDRVNINIDSVSGVNKPSEKFLQTLGPMVNISTWNRSPIISRVKMGTATLIGAKNIPRPQLTFKDPVDNSHNLWVPRISDKPNNIKPLALNIIYNDDGEAVGYEHPYAVELDLYHPPSRFIEPDPELPEFPPPIDQTPLTLVDTEEKLDELVKHLDECDEIAVDVEHHSYRSYQGITCLIQITTYEGGDFIIDTLAIREHVHKLNLSFTDPKKIKVFHGADFDVKWLQRDFGVYIVGLFDTFHAGKLLQLPSLSLKNLLVRYCQVDTDKKYQMADWRMRPLPAELITYARTDTHYLLYMWRMMKHQLLEKNSGLPNLLLNAFENSRHTSRLTYNKSVMNESSHMGLYIKSKKNFNTRQLSALKMLYKWRDSQARELDEGPSYLIPSHMLLALAETLPREVQGVHACCEPMPPFVRMNILNIHRMILSCRELPAEPQLHTIPAGVRTMLNVIQMPHMTCNVHDLAHYPDHTEEQINLDMAFVFLDPDYTEHNGVRLDVQPDVSALAAAGVNLSCGVVSTLNVDAKMFIPPYERYKKYRTVAQLDEIKDFKDKEAKVTALSQGDELIKEEVLKKIQKAKKGVVDEAAKMAPVTPNAETPEKPTDGKIAAKSANLEDKIEAESSNVEDKSKTQRKRKIDKPAPTQATDDKPKEPQKGFADDPKVKPFHYKNINYKKFYSASDKGHKQPKMKLKKP